MMKISSPVFGPNEQIPKKYTCEGEDVSPPLRIEDPSALTRSFALIVWDPDASTGDFAHWVLWNIDPEVREIKEAAVPPGAVVGMNDFGNNAWGGPCPPSGSHRYNFHLYALDSLIDLPETDNKIDLRNAIKGKILEERALTGLYQKES